MCVYACVSVVLFSQNVMCVHMHAHSFLSMCVSVAAVSTDSVAQCICIYILVFNNTW